MNGVGFLLLAFKLRRSRPTKKTCETHFMFMIMAFSSLATMFILPALLVIHPQLFFAENKKGVTCRCEQCMLAGGFVAAAVAYVLADKSIGWRPMTLVSIGVIVVFAALCHFAARRAACQTEGDGR